MGAFLLTVAASATIAIVLSFCLVLAIKRGQMDDLDTPALRILTEDLDES